MANESSKEASSRPEILRNRYNSGRQTRYSFPDKPMPHGIQFIFKDYDYNEFVNSLNKGETITSSTDGDPLRIQKFGLNSKLAGQPVPSKYMSIELPFPRALTDATSINNQAFERSFLFERLTSAIAQSGGIGGLAQQASQIASDILGAVRGVGSGDIDVIGKIQGVLNANGGEKTFGNVAAASQYLARTILPGDLQKQFTQAGGVIANPQTSLAFTGVDLKSFSFSWDLFPSNRKDSEQIKQIVRAIKNKALPSVGSVGDVAGLNRAFLSYPSVVIINLLGVDETHFVRFKPAMITNITVDYGTGGMVSIIKGGKPSAVTLRMDFTELNIHTAEDYAPDLSEDPTLGMTDFDPGIDTSSLA